MRLKNKNILLISPEAWGISFLSKHHYAYYLSKANRVFFLNPVDGWNPKMNVTTKNVNDSLTLVNYSNLVPRINKLPKKVQWFHYKQLAFKIQKALGCEIDIVWSFDPFRFWNLRHWNANKYIYHTVDFHPNATFEKDICKSADFVIGIADLINRPIREYKTIYKVGHGADIEGFHFKTVVKIPGKNKIKAGYVGNFHKHIDYKLLSSIANDNPNVDFILIGPYKANNLSPQGFMIENDEMESLKAKGNVYFLGKVPSNTIMSYLESLNINLVIFQDEQATIHCNPHKLMGYFYSGNVVISSFIDEYKDKPLELISMVKKNKDLPTIFKEIVNNLDRYNSEEYREIRKSYAMDNSYPKQIERIEAILNY